MTNPPIGPSTAYTGNMRPTGVKRLLIQLILALLVHCTLDRQLGCQPEADTTNCIKPDECRPNQGKCLSDTGIVRAVPWIWVGDAGGRHGLGGFQQNSAPTSKVLD